jgi:hypothetical protein
MNGTQRDAHTQNASILDPERYSTVNEPGREAQLAACFELLIPKDVGTNAHFRARETKTASPSGRVELIGFEPTTSGLQSPRSPS